MKKIILTSTALVCLPLFTNFELLVQEAHTKSTPSTQAVEATVTDKEPEKIEEKQDQEPIKMFCVWTSCKGSECDPKFADEKYASDYIEQHDNCYD